MNDKINIRIAKPEDYDQIHTLVLQVHKLHVNNRNDIYKDVDPLTKNEFNNNLNNEKNIYLVAETQGKIAGICFGQIKETNGNNFMYDRKVMNITDLCVSKNEQRRGIGQMLYNKMVQFSKELKLDSVELMVWGFNKNAIEFYKEIGMDVKNIRFEQKI